MDSGSSSGKGSFFICTYAGRKKAITFCIGYNCYFNLLCFKCKFHVERLEFCIDSVDSSPFYSDAVRNE